MYFLQSPIQVVGWFIYLSYFSKSFVFKVLEDKFVEIFLILPNFLSFFIVFTFLNLPYLRNVGRVRRSRRGYTFLKKTLNLLLYGRSLFCSCFMTLSMKQICDDSYDIMSYFNCTTIVIGINYCHCHWNQK